MTPPSFSSFPKSSNTQRDVDRSLRHIHHRSHRRGRKSTNESYPSGSSNTQSTPSSSQIIRQVTATATSDVDYFEDRVGDPDIRLLHRECSTGSPSYRLHDRTALSFPRDFLLETGNDRKQAGIELTYREHHSDGSLLRPLNEHPHTFAPSEGFDTEASFVLLEGPNGDQSAAIHFRSVENEVLHVIRELEQKVQQHPTEHSAWLRLAAVSAVGRSEATSQDLQRLSTRSAAEVALAVFTKSLKVCNHPDLRLGYLACGESVWELSQLWQEWKRALNLHPITQSLAVWRGYFDWRETTGYVSHARPFESLLVEYTNVLETLCHLTFTYPSESLEEVLLYFFDRCVRYIKQAGYQELAKATFQALMEVTFYRPKFLPSDTVDEWSRLLVNFGIFWDSQQPRFGEEGAEGWARSEVGSNGLDTASSRYTDLTGVQNLFAFETASKTLDFDTRLSAEKCSDPFISTISGDILPLMIPISTPSVRLQLIFAYIHFLGIDAVLPDTSTNTMYAFDPFLFPADDKRSIWPSRPVRAGKYPWSDTDAPKFGEYPSPNSTFDVETILPFRQARQIDSSPFIRNSLLQLSDLAPDPRLRALCMSFEAASSPKGASKLLRGVVAQDRDNLNLWRLFARLEVRRQRVSSARSVYAAAISSARAKSPPLLEDECDLWVDWVLLEKGERNSQQLQYMLSAAVDGTPHEIRQLADPTFAYSMTSARSLRARQFFAEISKAERGHFRLSFLYLTFVCLDHQKAHSVMEQYLTVASEADRESCFEFVITVLSTIRSLSVGRYVTKTANSALDNFPSNTMFLSKCAEMRLGVSRHAADSFIDGLLRMGSPSIVRCIFSIWITATVAGNGFWAPGSTDIDRLRFIFDRLLQMPKARKSPTLWRLAIDLEGVTGGVRLKQMCFRAVAACPANKSLYLLPFSPNCRERFTDRELAEWIRLMLERGLRLHASVNAELLFRESEGHLVQSDDEAISNDELAFLREQEQLKPYA